MEMADILFVLICMANREGIDLQDAFDRMMAKVETRDRDRWKKKGGQAVGRSGGQADRRSGGQADRRLGGQADRRSGGQADRRSVDQADGWADERYGDYSHSSGAPSSSASSIR